MIWNKLGILGFVTTNTIPFSMAENVITIGKLLNWKMFKVGVMQIVFLKPFQHSNALAEKPC